MPKVVLLSHELVGPKMAGPGIRYASLARVLAKHVDVTLAAPVGSAPVADAAYRMAIFARGNWESLAPVLTGADTIVLPPDLVHEFPQIRSLDACVAIDGYNPLLAEWLSTHDDLASWRLRMDQLRPQYYAGDFYFCASERQRDWWLGQLEAHGRINPLTLADDPSLRQLIDVVPYGLTPPSAERRHTPVIKGVWPGIGLQDKVLLWGGGLWPWLDPFTAIQATALLSKDIPEIRLVFPGTRHPNPDLAGLHTHLEAARDQARALGLLDTHVFFGDWVPYELWPDVLQETDVALSLHHDTFETRLAFRSRIVEYVGARIPVVATKGDATSELLERYAIGETVAENDGAGAATAITRLLRSPRASFENGWTAARQDLDWEQVARALIRFCQSPRRAPDRAIVTDQVALNAGLMAQNARLTSLVHAYEKGRFMRLMRWLKRSKS